MHDCRKFEDGLVDLVFDALTEDEKRRRLAELASCESCRNEYRSATESLVAFDQAVEASLPNEGFWPRHHDLLRQSISRNPAASKVERVPFWRRALSARVSVPAPAFALVAIAVLAVSVLAFRRSIAKYPIDIPQTIAVAPATKIIEVPVVSEKVVVRTVYVAKALKPRNGERRVVPNVRRNEMETARESGQGGLFTRANLTDFQPPDEMRIRVLKRSSTDEN